MMMWWIMLSSGEVSRQQCPLGESRVVLVGDFLYSKSILMTVGYNDIRILQALSDATTKMAEGEVMQLIHADNLEISEQEYLEVITRKTAVLISAACQIGAIFGVETWSRKKALRTYGHNLGIAFQLIDDTLDYTGTSMNWVSPWGMTYSRGKLPYLLFMLSGMATLAKRKGYENCSAPNRFVLNICRNKRMGDALGRDRLCAATGVQEYVERAKRLSRFFRFIPPGKSSLILQTM